MQGGTSFAEDKMTRFLLLQTQGSLPLDQRGIKEYKYTQYFSRIVTSSWIGGIIQIKYTLDPAW